MRCCLRPALEGPLFCPVELLPRQLSMLSGGWLRGTGGDIAGCLQDREALWFERSLLPLFSSALLAGQIE